MVSEKYRAMRNQFEALAAQIPVQADLTYKDMFGGVCVYTQGRPFATFAGETLALKLPEDAQRGVIEEAAGEADYSPEAPGGKQYITLPKAILDDEAKLLYWIEDSLRYVHTLAPRKRKSKSPRPRWE
jgi:TfoX/Sxy family transcriptional regulator of competence genes